MSTGIIRNSGGYQSSGSSSSSSSRPSGGAALTDNSATNAHRNRNLLDSYHDFAMQIFGSNHTQEVELQFLNAIENGDADRVENLLKRRSHEIFNIDVKDSETGNTPIILAAKNGHLKITQLLLKYGADITLRNYDNETALDIARPSVIRPLLDSVSRPGSSPRHLLQASWQGDHPTVKRLLSESKILDINCRNVEGFTPLLLVTRDVEVFDKFGSMLQNYNPLAVISELLRHRADPIARDSEGKTALHYASSSPSKLAEEIVNTLIQQPALLEVKDNRSLAPIHSASQSGQIEVVLALLDSGANVNARGFAGSTPLHVSAYSGQYQVATTLLGHGADITLVDDSGNTAVDVAKTKRLKSTLKEAWTEATQSKQEVVLNPLRAPSRVDMSSDERSPRDNVSPREKFMMRKFTDAHKAVLAEEQMLRDIDNGKVPQSPSPRKPSYPRSSSRNSNSAVKTPIPPRTPRYMEQKKPPKSTEKNRSPKRSLSLTTKPKGDQKVRGHHKLAYTRSDPSGDVNQVPVTVVGLDLDESLRDIRLQRLVHGPVAPFMEKQTTADRCGTRLSQMPQNETYQPPSTTALTNPRLTDVTDACNEYMKKGRKAGTRRLSAASTDDGDSDISWPRTKRKSPRKHVLNLEQMHLKRSTPSPMSDCIRMFPNARFVLPQSPAVSTGDNLLGETIFEFDHENENMQNSATSGFFMSSARRLSSGASGHFSNNTWRLPQNVQRSHSTVSEESTSPENVDESQDMRVESVNTFNIELSRVSPLKESSDSGQGSSRSTGSQGSSFSDSTPSPATHSDHDSLVKMSVKNRLGIGMTPAATQVQENTRFNSRLHPHARTEEVRDLRRGLVKSALATTISLAGLQQLGTIPVERQPELQSLVSKREFGELDTITEGSRQTSANSESLQSRVQSRRASDAASCAQNLSDKEQSVVRPPLITTRRGSKGDHENTMTVLTNGSLKGPPEESHSINKLSVLPDLKSNSASKDSNTEIKTSANNNRNGNNIVKETAKQLNSGSQKAVKETVKQPDSDSKKAVKETAKQTDSDSKKAANERIVIKKLGISKQNTDLRKETSTDSKAKESAAEKTSSINSSDTKISSPATNLTKGSRTSNILSTTKNVDDKSAISISKSNNNAKPVVKTGSESASVSAASNVSSAAKKNDSSVVKKVESEMSRTVCKPDTQKTKSAIISKELKSEFVSSNSGAKTVTKEPGKETTCTTVSQQRLVSNSEPSQNAPPMMPVKNKTNANITPQPKQTISSTTSPHKQDSLLKVVTKVQTKPPNKATSATARSSNKVDDPKDPKKTNSTSPRKLETAKSSLTESAPGPNVSKGKPSLAKSFNSSGDKNIQTELRKAKEEVGMDSQSDKDSQAKILVERATKEQTHVTNSNSKSDEKQDSKVSSTTKTGSPAVAKSNEALSVAKKTSATPVTIKSGVATESKKSDSSNKKETDNKKSVPSVSKVTCASKPTVADSKSTVIVKKETKNTKKRPEDSNVNAKTNSVQSQKENKTKKQKVNHGSNQSGKIVAKAGIKTNKPVHNVNDEEDESDVESMEDVEEMFEAVTFVEDEERELEEERKPEDIVHIEIKTQEEMLADEPKTEAKKKEKPVNKTKLPNKTQTKKDAKSKAPIRNSGSGKGGKVVIVNAKSLKGTTQQSSKPNKISVSTKAVKKIPVKTQQSKSAGQIVRKSTLSGKHSLSCETLSESSPPKKPVVENTPVIEDIMDVIKAVNHGVTPTPWRRSVSVDDVSSPRKKSTSPKRGGSVKSKPAEKTSSAPSKGKGQTQGKVNNQSKPVKKQSVGSAGKNKDGFATVSNKKGQAGKIKKGQLKDLQLLSESEKQTTAFITGHGWQIKTDRNETDDVIINDPLDTTDSSDDEEMTDASVQLSPHHTMKLQKLKIPPLDLDLINNLANIMTPLESNTPRYLPDTMDTIKEFVDSLKSNEAEEIALMIKNDKNGNLSQVGVENQNLVATETPPPMLPTKESAQTTDNPPELPPKLASFIGPRPETDGSEPPALPRKEKKSKTEVDLPPELPPELPPKLLSSQKLDVDFNDPIKESAVIKEPRTDGDGAEDLSLNSYKTNPELLKVFHIPDHYEAGRGSKSPATQETNGNVKDAVPAIAQQKEVKDGETGSPKPINELRTDIDHVDADHQQDAMKAIKDDIASKPPLPKTRSGKKRKVQLRRINSEPSCLLDTSGSDDELEDVFTPGRGSNRKASLPVGDKSRDAYSPRSARELKKRTENTSLAKYIREKQDAGEMLQETHRLENLKELDEDEIIRKEQLLNEHIQDMTISALQEFNSLLSPISEGVESTSLPLRPPSSARDHEDHLGGAGDVDFLNKSLPMSEVSEVSASTMRSEDVDTLVSELHSSGSISSRGLSGSSMLSSERSHSSNTTASEPEGELLHWKKGNLLGRGAFGTVYCGLTSVGQLIAVKQVELSEKDKDKSHKEYETLQEEVQLLKTLRHRNIVGFLGCCLEGSTVNIFMQFIPGGSIASLLARFGALDEPVFCRYTKMILDGTDYLHANNVIHRDIKGANIMLMSNGVIKLIDFGCAKRLCLNMSQSQNLLKSMRGTPYWMAPEVIMETGHGKKSDIWSIGCTVFEMATRKPPWSEMPPMPAIFAIGSGEKVPQLPDKFSPEARDFVNSCLTRDQNKRPSATDLMTHSFIRNRKDRFYEQFRRISGSSLEDSQITFKEQPTNRGDSTGSRGRRMDSFK